MSAVDYVLVALFLFAMLSTVATVGKPRKPMEPGAAVIAVVIDLALIAGILWARGVLS